MRSREEHRRNSGKGGHTPNRPDQQQRFSTNFIDDGHGEENCDKICHTDGHRLKITGNLAGTRASKDIVQVVQHCVNSRKLVKHADGNSQENRQPELPGK